MKTSRSLTNQIRTLNRVRPDRQHIPSLFYMTDEKRGADPARIAKNLPAGSGIILRHYDHPDRANIAARLANICRKRRLVFLVAKDVMLAIKVRADGVHVPDYMLHQIPMIRHKLPQRGIITAASHSHRRVLLAKTLSTDAAIISPVYATLSHPGKKSLGSLAIRNICQNSDLLLIGLGGISVRNVNSLKNIGLHGIAAISALE